MSSTSTTTPAAHPRLPSQADGAPGARGPRRPRLYVLDGLRLLAALAVVLYHYTGQDRELAVWGDKAAHFMPRLHALTMYGWAGVEFFFLISGFVVCMSCWGRSLGDFATSRITRLFPAYWFAVLATAAALFAVRPPWAARITAESYPNVIANLTMAQEGIGAVHVDGVYWTLWVELRFYFLFGLLLIGGLTYRKVVAFCAGWTILSVYLAHTDVPLLDTLFFPRYSSYFVAGVALFLVHRFGPTLINLGLVGVSWALSVWHLRTIVAEINWLPLSYDRTFALITVFYLVMLAVALGWFNRIQWKWLTTAGALTYPLYLIHEYPGFILIHHFRRSMGPYALVASVVAVMLVGAWLVHRLIERPLAPRLKRGIERGLVDLRKH
ncbi:MULTISPECIES: acyltransferase [Kitasatospora]|uniref:Putative acyltransferase n=1 Tax=Kitasatospora setae (strain ATCC 33774 / DSM 43861 / JCM 3304 / KCC A-0304 / NBRC 14216 / KM-6054) TaxID=452652 RepID=E4NGS4_KITSK|nr:MULTISPECIES: acyltransferase [Kitasatospora]BAJ30704.1 putative acyltransferase [Kitasatospora setae KM-6054]